MKNINNVGQVLHSLDRLNLSINDLGSLRKAYYPRLAAEWLKSPHLPGWYITDEGISSTVLPTGCEHFGIWISDNLIVSSQMMSSKDTFQAAENFIYNRKLGPFYWRMADKNEHNAVTSGIPLVSKALAKCGRPKVPEDFYWTNSKIILKGETCAQVNHTAEQTLALESLDASCLGIFVINIAP